MNQYVSSPHTHECQVVHSLRIITAQFTMRECIVASSRLAQALRRSEELTERLGCRSIRSDLSKVELSWLVIAYEGNEEQ